MSTDITVLALEMRPHLKRSVTTAAGNVAGTTLVDNTLTEPNDFWNGMAILIRTAGATADCSGQLRRVLDWDLATNTLTVNVPFTDLVHPADPKIEAGIQYVVFFPTIIPVDVLTGGLTKADLQQVLGQGADIAPGNELLTEDTGVNTNPERWLHEHHWEQREVTIAVAGAPGEQNLGVAVPAAVTRRVRTLVVRHVGTNNTVVTLLVSGGAVSVSFDLLAQSTRVLSAEDGWEFLVGEQSAVQTSDVTGGNTYVSAIGDQA